MTRDDEAVGREITRAVLDAEKARIAKARGEEPVATPRKARPVSRVPRPEPKGKGSGKKK